MNDFIASNEMIVRRDADKDLLVLDPLERNTLEGFSYLDADDEQALREFFRAEEDERLGRWRWPENPDYVVYPQDARGLEGVLVIDVRDGYQREFTSRSSAQAVPGSIPAHAALAYFDAHPEPKPWHDAKPGEIWALGIGGGYHGDSIAVVEVDGAPRFIWHVGGENGIRNIAINDRVIDYGRRVWPEDAS